MLWIFLIHGSPDSSVPSIHVVIPVLQYASSSCRMFSMVADNSSDRGWKANSNLSLDYTENEGQLELQDSKGAVHKLDVMTSKQFNRMLFLNIILVVWTFVQVTVASSLCNTTWKGSKTRKGVDGKDFTYTTCSPSTTYVVTMFFIDLFGRVVLIVLAILFIIRVFRAKKKHRSEEQAWAVMMLATTALSYSPGLNLLVLNDNLHQNDPTKSWARFPAFLKFITISRMINLWLASFGQLFYVR